MLRTRKNCFKFYTVWSVALIGLVFNFFTFAAESNYRLSAGDKINIIVYGETDLSMKTTLGGSGVINYPFLGEVAVKNMTIKELEQYIRQKLNGDFLVNPNVHVSIDEYRPFFINGQVENPGGYPYQSGLTIQRAVSLGGGFTERASKKNVFIVHENQPEKRVRATQHMRVNPGDIITVEESFF
ncbi:MAG: polysaccharide export protein [Gammaproteobacteria bacterium]|nr:polysaccharide export protein [Gammaproteobacteria bacterium]